MMTPNSRAGWMALGPQITELSASGLNCIEICAALDIESTRANHTNIAIVRRHLGLPKMKSGTRRGVPSDAASPSAVWADYEITSDWRDLKCVERDMGGRRFEDVTFRGASRDPVFMPARKRVHSAGVADYSGAR